MLLLEGYEIGVVPRTQVGYQFLNHANVLIMSPLLFPLCFSYLDKFFFHPRWCARLASRKLDLLRVFLLPLQTGQCLSTAYLPTRVVALS